MTLHFPSMSIRTRLLVAYVGLLIIGFAGLTLVAGRQIETAARADYERRLQNEIRLIARGVSPYVQGWVNLTEPDDEFEELIQEFEDQTGGTLTLFLDRTNVEFQIPLLERELERGEWLFDLEDNFSGRLGRFFRDYPEIETALRSNEITITQRTNEFGQDSLYTAAQIAGFPRRPAVVQLSVPVHNLEALIWQRWMSLGIIFGLVTVLSLLAALLLSRSIIRPLYALRDSAVQLSEGDFTHRVDYNQKDEIGEVAQAFNNMAHQVESMLEEQRAFASNTSHELRTPLTTIRLRTEALRYDGLDNATATQYVAEIDDEINRLTALIEDLTLLSRLDAGRAELGDTEIDFARLGISLGQRLRPQADAKAIDLCISDPQDIIPVQASLTHLTVVFRNVLDNAIKYTPEGGKISWHIHPEGNGVCNIIQDNGNGISTDQLPHLFERFYRADKAHSRNVPGTGLGLAIVKSIVEAYGGWIKITSEGIGQGTTVTVFWPYRITTPQATS